MSCDGALQIGRNLNLSLSKDTFDVLSNTYVDEYNPTMYTHVMIEISRKVQIEMLKFGINGSFSQPASEALCTTPSKPPSTIANFSYRYMPWVGPCTEDFVRSPVDTFYLGDGDWILCKNFECDDYFVSENQIKSSPVYPVVGIEALTASDDDQDSMKFVTELQSPILESTQLATILEWNGSPGFGTQFRSVSNFNFIGMEISVTNYLSLSSYSYTYDDDLDNPVRAPN